MDRFDKGCALDVKGDTSGPLLFFPLFLTLCNVDLTGDDSTSTLIATLRGKNKTLCSKKFPHTRPAVVTWMTIVWTNWNMKKSTQSSWEVISQSLRREQMCRVFGWNSIAAKPTNMHYVGSHEDLILWFLLTTTWTDTIAQ